MVDQVIFNDLVITYIALTMHPNAPKGVGGIKLYISMTLELVKFCFYIRYLVF